MGKIIIRGCAIMTMNRARECFSGGEIWIDGNQLTYVGAQPPDMAAPAEAEVIDGREKVALPGFINAHHHLFMTLLRGLSPDSRLPQWLASCIRPAGPHLRPEDLYLAARLGLAECVDSGVTSTMDWASNLHTTEHAAAILEAMRDSGARVHFAYGPSSARGMWDYELHVNEFEEIRARYFANGDWAGRIRLWAGLGGPENRAENLFREEFSLARQYGLGVHIHLREIAGQPPDNIVERMEKWGVLGPHLLLAHAIHLDDGELDLLGRTGTRVSYNALSNMRLGSGICRVVEMRRRQIGVALGLDGSACNDNSDFFALMRAGLGLQRARHERADCLTVTDILSMATADGAHCLGDDDVGVLEAGKKADLILLDCDACNFAPVNDFVSQTVLCGQPRNVDTVIVDGRILKRRGELQGIDMNQLIGKCREASKRLLSEAGLTSRRPSD
ncbi:MAG: amidohydrolase family protein [Candidatus Binataceae bacterium]